MNARGMTLATEVSSRLGLARLQFARGMCRVAASIACVALAAGASFGQSRAEYGPHFDRRLELPAVRSLEAVTPQSTQVAAVAELRESLNGSLLASFDRHTGVTRTLSNPVGTLTAAQSGEPEAIALDFVTSHLELLGLRVSDLDQMAVCDSVYSAVTRSHHFYFCQRFQGLEIFNAQLRVTVNDNGAIVGVNNSFVPDLQQLDVNGEIGADASSAVMCAAKHLGISMRDGPRQNAASAASGSVEVVAPDLSTAPIQADEAWLPVGRGVKRVWRFRVHRPGNEHVYELMVDAEPGLPTDAEERVLTRFDLVARDQYRVYPLPTESPNHTTPLPPQDARTLEVNPAHVGASMLGWHDTGTISYTTLRGNNVRAYEDRDANNAPPAIEPDCGPTLECDFPIDLTRAPSTYIAAAVTNLFYWNNVVHDVQYQYGFDEAAGNFQVNNFGRGGNGGDAVNAEGLDGEGVNNANFLTLPDGIAPRMQMFVWTHSNPFRAGGLDSGVVVHEYGHGISNRQVGGPSNTFCLLNPQQPGEGWSDWLALAYTARVGDVGADGRGIGTYVEGQPTNGAGIRTQRYSTDPAVNTHTYESISGMSVPHGVGEVWGQALWEVYWALVNEHGFDPDLYNALGDSGNQRMMLYVNEGLKATACSPTFTNARDGILQAAISSHGGEDVCLLWEAFAEFGLGVNALSGGPSSTSPTNGFDIPASCAAGMLTGTVQTPSAAPISGALVHAGNVTAVTDASGSFSVSVPAGTYEVGVSAFGFFPATRSDVVIEVGMTTNLDIVELSPRPLVEIGGLVTDGSGAGWPLYARIDVTGTNLVTSTLFTAPTDGLYGPVPLFVGETYDFVVTSLVPGYRPESDAVTITATGDPVDFTLFVDDGRCEAPGYVGGRLVSEAFEQDFPPAGWQVSSSTTGCAAPGVPQWTNTDPGGRNNFTGGSGLFAIADADACGPAVAMDTAMTSPPFDLSSLGPGDTLRIEFKHLFVQFSGNETVDVDVWDGSSWVSVRQFGGHGGAFGTVVINTAAANGVSDAKVRFRYAARHDFWWSVDDVVISVGPTEPTCSFVGGSLVTGNVFDDANGEPLDGAVIRVAGGGASTTGPTPADDNVPDGFYLTHAPAGQATITASLSGYADNSQVVDILDGGVVPIDFTLTRDVAPPTLRLEINGEHPDPPFVITSGPTRLTLSMTPGDTTNPLSWYFAIIVNSQVYWVTLSGISTTLTPLATAPPTTLQDVVLLDTSFSPGDTYTFAFFLVDGANTLAVDFIAVVVPP